MVYRRDPVPPHKSRRLNLLNDPLLHVHGEIYIDDEQLTPGKQPTHSLKDAEDHGFMRYAEVLLNFTALLSTYGLVVVVQTASAQPECHPGT